MKTQKIKKFFSSRAGRSAVLVAAVLVIGLAVYLNYRWFYDPIDALGYGENNMEDAFSDSATADGNAESNYFTATALSREQSRDEAIDVLRLISESAESTEAARAEANARISRIAVDMQNEANIETLVKAKGFEECVAVISEGAVSIIVKAESLQANEAAQILAIAHETTGISHENISIINK